MKPEAAPKRSLRPRDASSKAPPNPKLCRWLNNLKAVYQEHPTRVYVPGFSINDDCAYVALLHHESTHVVELKDCWTSTNFPEMVALLGIVVDRGSWDVDPGWVLLINSLQVV
ncbi:BZ3500_MvSof-1268-A1-R1_Chr2-2g04955 [Microbotryum saponariae]|uniref:BZ3500_MvSof-1268-A1-R1_Chr2-2g04955 protein n=1 Tax=Microbotryum saponariae TaxID=289078 RepID=A0A2X0L6M7_9BASI|nr:BZ3500_MvSof-1268-A1-R1_Chr2-2g04955 [Microbotryum saponariae]SDA00560.1 BZ3501_MvSof-1269-A2-R1_Chr2-2g04629 [Microbotryum saponariae]